MVRVDPAYTEIEGSDKVPQGEWLAKSAGA